MVFLQKSVKNISKKQQNIRFSYLFKSANVANNDKILDLGCGYGEMLTYLRKNKIGKYYLGLDYIEGFVNHASRKFATDKNASFEIFNLKKETLNNEYDWVVSSGLFHDIRHDSKKFFYETINKMYSACRKGLIFNAMSTHVDYQDPSLFYLAPEKVINYVAKNLSKKFYLDLTIKLKNIIPYEFTLCVTKYKQ